MKHCAGSASTEIQIAFVLPPHICLRPKLGGAPWLLPFRPLHTPFVLAFLFTGCSWGKMSENLLLLQSLSPCHLIWTPPQIRQMQIIKKKNEGSPRASHRQSDTGVYEVLELECQMSHGGMMLPT